MSLRPGVQRYVDQAKEEMKARSDAVRRAKRLRFDTIAVHGLYGVREAIERNQGAIIEPMVMATSQAYRDSDELEAALCLPDPTWCYARIANPPCTTSSGRWRSLRATGSRRKRRAARPPRDGRDHVDGGAVPGAAPGREHEPVNFVSSCQVYGGTFQQFAVRQREKGQRGAVVRHPERIEEWEAQIDGHTRFLYGELPPTPTCVLRHRCGRRARPCPWHSTHRRLHGGDACPDAAVAPRRGRRGPLGDEDHDGLRFGIAGALISRRNIVTNIPNEELRKDFAS